MAGLPPWILLWLLYVVTGSLRTSLGMANPDYLPTLAEDPLQSVWDNMDTIPIEILNGFKNQMEFHTLQIQTSLTEIFSRLSSMEDKIKQEVFTLREEISDLVTDRLVNAETMILEDISKLSNAMTSIVKENCDVHEEVIFLTQKLTGMVNETLIMVATCSAQSVHESVRVEEAAAKAVKMVTNVEEEATAVRQTAVRMEQVAARMEEVAMKVDEVVTSTNNMNQTHQTTTIAGVETQIKAAYLPRDCSDIHWQQPEAPSGVYQTFPSLDPKAHVKAYCDMGRTDVKETGGWTVILRRHNSSFGLEDFNRSWVEYGEGFGQPGEGEWWYGLANLHALTYRQPFEVEIILHDLELGTFQAAYTSFRVESEGRNFRLLASGFSGNVSYDALGSLHHGEPFSTFDRDLDSLDEGNCASFNGGGWWYKNCHKTTLTATFPTSLNRDSRTIRWYTPDTWLVFDDVSLKIRPTNYGSRFQTYEDED